MKDSLTSAPRSGSARAAVRRARRNGEVHTSRTSRRYGRKAIACAFADHEAAMARATSGLTPGERALAIDLLRKLGLTAQSLLHDLDKNRALSSNE